MDKSAPYYGRVPRAPRSDTGVLKGDTEVRPRSAPGWGIPVGRLLRAYPAQLTNCLMRATSWPITTRSITSRVLQSVTVSNVGRDDPPPPPLMAYGPRR